MTNKDQNINEVGFDYTLNLNQIGAMNAGLLGKIDDKEILIFESFIKYSAWSGCQKIVRKNKIYFEYPWQKVAERIPFLQLKSRTPIKKRFQKLVEVNLLEPHPNNNSMSKSFFAFGSQFPAYSNQKMTQSPSSTEDATVLDRPQRRTLPSSTEDATVLNGGRSPSSTEDAYEYTNEYNSDINSDFFKKGKKFEKFQALLPHWIEWKKYLKKVHKKNLTKDQEEVSIQHLLNCADDDIEIAQKIIVQARSGNFTNFIPLQGNHKRIAKNKFPDEWDESFFKKLSVAEHPKYYKHLRELGLKPVRHQNRIIKWEKSSVTS